MSSPLQHLCLIAAIVLTPTLALRADETYDAFLAIWKQQADQPSTAAAWQAFAAKYPNHDLAWSARLLGGEDLLRQDDAKKGLAVFESVLNDPAAASSEPHRLAAKAAKNLIAWAKMSLLAEKLETYYRKHVEYPPSLDDLVSSGIATEADVTDPFETRYVYAAMERSTFPGIARQKFTLACPSIHAQQDDLAATLEAAKSAPKGVVLGATEPKDRYAFIKKARPDGSMGPSQRMNVGQELGDVVMWFVGDGYVVIAWRGFPEVILKE